MATPADIEAAIATAAVEGIAEAISDGQSAKAISADDQIKLADRAAAVTNIGAGSAWGGAIRPARALPNWTEIDTPSDPFGR